MKFLGAAALFTAMQLNAGSVYDDNKCVDLTADGYINIVQHTDFDRTADSRFVVMGWFKRDNTSQGSQSVFDSRSYISSTWSDGIQINIDDLDPGEGKVGLTKGGTGFASSTELIVAGEWHHLAVVFESGSQARIYIDGVLDTTVSHAKCSESWASADLRFGRSGSGFNKYQGQMDGLKIWNGTNDPFTADSIRREMLSATPIVTDGLIALYNCDEVAGTTMADSSGTSNLHDGTVTSGGTVAVASTTVSFLTNMSSTSDKSASGVASGIAGSSLTISNSTFAAGEFVAYGDNSNDADPTFGSFWSGVIWEDNGNLGGIAQDQITDRVWYINNTADTDTVTLVFDLTNAGYNDITGVAPFDLHLLYATDNQTAAFSSVGTADTNVGGVLTFTIPADQLANGYYGVGSSSNILTPAYGVATNLDNGVLNWTVDYEDGVVSYKVEKKIDGIWETMTAVAATGEAGAEYRITVGEGEGEFRITAVDASGYSQSFSVDTPTAYINLTQGWNLISIPFDNADNRALTETASGTIWSWNGNTYVEVTDPSALQGLWIYSSDIAEVEVSGTEPVSAEVTLSKGWNLYGPAVNCAAPDGITTYSWNNTYQQILDNGGLIQGQAYWFYADEEQSIELK